MIILNQVQPHIRADTCNDDEDDDDDDKDMSENGSEDEDELLIVERTEETICDTDTGDKNKSQSGDKDHIKINEDTKQDCINVRGITHAGETQEKGEAEQVDKCTEDQGPERKSSSELGENTFLYLNILCVYSFVNTCSYTFNFAAMSITTDK